jgi:hypothetical protein
MAGVGSAAGTGSSSAPVSVLENVIAKGSVSVTDAYEKSLAVLRVAEETQLVLRDEQLMRGALEALKHGLTLQCGTSDDAHNTYLTGDLSGKHTEDCQGCAMEDAITKLEERLLKE